MDDLGTLLAAIEAPHPRTRQAALLLLTEWGDRDDPSVPPALARAAQDPHWPVRVAALYAAERLAVRLPGDAQLPARASAQTQPVAPPDPAYLVAALVRFGDAPLHRWFCENLSRFLATREDRWAQGLGRQTLQAPDRELRLLLVSALQAHPSRQGYTLLCERVPGQWGRSAVELDREVREAIRTARDTIHAVLADTDSLPIPGTPAAPEREQLPIPGEAGSAIVAGAEEGDRTSTGSIWQRWLQR
ncbi:MAG: hypothetical protein FJX77_11055 [Armatimonadetes bacterium]|nr:hypothetical protein [Armatimonadota bacterium]